MSYYNWKPNEEFTFLGVELEYYLAILNQKLNTPEAREILAAAEFNKLLDKKVEEGLKDGKIKEYELHPEQVEEIKEKTPN